MDSRATHHVCYNELLFSNLHQLPTPSTVNLPNGIVITNEFVGIVSIFLELVLQNVLFIPSFHYNLLSISSLLASYPSFSFEFTANCCSIQNLSQSQPIGKARRLDKLYVMKSEITSVQFPISCNKVYLDDTHIWHCCLGHPSYHKIFEMKQNLPNVSNFYSHAHCDVCHLAIQNRLPFASHITFAPKPFDLLHIDIMFKPLKGINSFLPLWMITHVSHGYSYLNKNKMF